MHFINIDVQCFQYIYKYVIIYTYVSHLLIIIKFIEKDKYIIWSISEKIRQNCEQKLFE